MCMHSLFEEKNTFQSKVDSKVKKKKVNIVVYVILSCTWAGFF